MPSAHYDYFDHEADIGIIGSGLTLEAAFVQAARAVFAYMANLDEVQPIQSRIIEFVEEDSELALVEWLNALLGEARQSNLVFSNFTLRREQNHWSVRRGENRGVTHLNAARK